MHELREILMPVAIFGTIGFIVISLSRLFTNYQLRKKMIEKDLIGEDAVKLLTSNTDGRNKYSSLKWGLIILFGGIGLIVIEPLVHQRDLGSLPFGLFAVCTSIGFLIYYFLMRKNK